MFWLAPGPMAQPGQVERGLSSPTGNPKPPAAWAGQKLPGGGCFCGLHCAPILCGPQNQVLAKPMPHRPALLGGPCIQATNRHAYGIGRPALPGLPRLLAFLALALCAHFMRAPKLSFGQACVPALSFACWALHAGHQRAYQWPSRPAPTLHSSAAPTS